MESIKGDYEGQTVWLDCPMPENQIIDEDGMIYEAEYKGREVELNKPVKGSPKNYVYVKNEKGNVIKLKFGSGMRNKMSDPKARKAFAKRHKCGTGEKKWTARYWSCRATKFPQLNNNSVYPGYW